MKALVREYMAIVEPHGITFDDYLKNALVQISNNRSRELAGELLGPEEKSGRPTAHNDHRGGEAATWNVFVERDLSKLMSRAVREERHDRHRSRQLNSE